MMHRPRLSRWQVAGWTVGLAAALMVLRLEWVEPWLRAPGRQLYGRPIGELQPVGLVALPFAATLALAIAVLIGLAVANRHRWRAILRPNRGRVIGALALAYLTPVAIYSWWPWILGGLTLFLGFLSFEVFFKTHGAVLIAAALWYPAACLIVSGIHGRVMRVAVFALMFWAAYSAIILVVGAGEKFSL